jgi:hypothetical protein
MDWGAFDEGLGTTYERFVLDRIFEDLSARRRVESVAETPIYGMTGIDGINSVWWAKRGAEVTLVDDDTARTNRVRAVWDYLDLGAQLRLAAPAPSGELPFDDRRFDLVWNFAALWHVPDPGLWVAEMCRVSKGVVAIFVPNRYQLGYLMRKYLFDREFFARVHEAWVEPPRIEHALSDAGFRVSVRGVMDVPPWPDTCVPISALWKGKQAEKREEPGAPPLAGASKRWHWNILRHYRDEDHELRRRVERLAFLDRLRVPPALKLCWGHHRYLIAERV